MTCITNENEYIAWVKSAFSRDDFLIEFGRVKGEIVCVRCGCVLMSIDELKEIYFAPNQIERVESILQKYHKLPLYKPNLVARIRASIFANLLICLESLAETQGWNNEKIS